MDDRGDDARRGRRFDAGLTAAACVVFVAGMVGMAFAAVPLYRIFCQVTGFGGTTQQASAAPGETVDRYVTVRFDANIASDLGWSFRPLGRSVRVKLGEVGQGSFLAQNRGQRTTTGTAVFNVTPTLAGVYFNKLECFCFTDQTLAPRQAAEMGVAFFVDPAYADDPDLDPVTTITLSYTFFPTTTPAPPRSVAAVAPPQPAGPLGDAAPRGVTLEQ